jgi:hypothetical protein
MGVGWQLLRALPKGELSRLSDAQIERHLGGGEDEEAVAASTARRR